ncbi:hypothetical protein JL739_03455 [Listeria welshimeri]|uniref:hypothetical protein n=1 Tax=Listeria welshimeri TaxID=1643 RepID=UPI0010B1D7A6|nr:hypothetical protein [Listeria welshimeri]MBC1389955.1 hypothetical protein [Listeria welshimeri]MBC1395310.1 hypothetical protein [Listeria welshimeri]MBC1409513.1 hypothetical protein [Listeria welshimeri]MBC1445809.1 hypothetical protein [Listeria welshimeri]MBC1476238.1 hypothetical protein [Listeria welshimeri]
MDYLNVIEIAWNMDDTPEKEKLLEQAITIADKYNDLKTSVEAREMLITSYMTTGFPKKQLQAFSWLINKWEEGTGCIDTYDLLWNYKWISENVSTFEEVSKEQINNLLTDMKAKYEQQNFSLRPYYKVCTLTAIQMGEVENAIVFFEKWTKTEQDYLNDCSACETNDQAYFYYFIKDYEQAKKLATPIIIEEMSCGEVPHLTYGFMALVYLELDDIKMAQHCFDEGYPLVEKQTALILSLSHLLKYLVLTEQNEKVREVIDTNKEIVLNTESDLDRLLFLQAAYPLFDREKEADLIEMTEALTAKFDARNGNNYYQDLLKK